MSATDPTASPTKPSSSARKGRTRAAMKERESARNRSRSLINQLAGANANAATKTRWIMELATNIDLTYHNDIQEQKSRAEAAEAELKRLQLSSSVSAEQARHRNDALEERVWAAEQRALSAEAKWVHANAELSHIQSCLHAAAAAAANGSAECSKLQVAFQELTRAEQQERKAINTRSHEAKEALVSARGRLKDAKGTAKAQGLQLERVHAEAAQAVAETALRAAEAQEAAEAYRRSAEELEREMEELKKNATARGGTTRGTNQLRRGSTAASRGTGGGTAQHRRRAPDDHTHPHRNKNSAPRSPKKTSPVGPGNAQETKVMMRRLGSANADYNPSLYACSTPWGRRVA